MFTVIYNKETKRIINVFEKKDGMIYGYSDNCAEATVEEMPEGMIFDGDPDPVENA